MKKRIVFFFLKMKRRRLSSPGAKKGRDPFNQNSDRSDGEKRTTSKGGPVFSKFFRLDWTDPLSFGPKFPEILVEWIAPKGRALREAHALCVTYFVGQCGIFLVTWCNEGKLAHHTADHTRWTRSTLLCFGFLPANLKPDNG